MASKRATLESLVSFRNSQGDSARGTLLKLDRSMVVFEVYNPYSIVQLSEVLDELVIRRGDRAIYQGRAVVTNLVNTGLMLIVSVTLVDPWTDLAGLLVRIQDDSIREEVSEFVGDWRRANVLRPGYQLAVSKLRSFLVESSRWLEQVDVHLDERERDGSGGGAEEILQEIGAPLLPVMLDLFKDFEEEASLVPDEEVDRHKTFAQRDLHALLLRVPFLHRTFYKPLGYAGDYEMMNMIQRDPLDGPSAYTRLVNKLFLQAPIPQSVRNRNDMLLEYLTAEAGRVENLGRRLDVMDIGCGPALEVQRFFAGGKSAPGCRFTLVDFNQETLNYAKSKVNESLARSSGRGSVSYIHESVHNLLKLPRKEQQEEEEREYDFVYCSGLFDYLSDRVCGRLLRLFYSWLRPGGMVLVTNMHTSNPDRFCMEFLMEWYLIYRDEQVMASLAPGFGRQSVFTDSTGVNVVLEMRKPDVESAE